MGLSRKGIIQIVADYVRTVKELGLEEKPSQIWNLDESSFCSDPSKTKIVGQRGHPSSRTTSGPGKQNTTVLMCCNAIGEKGPLLIIFKGKNVWDQWIVPPGTEFPNTTYAATSNGWMESTVFKNYFEKSFIKQLPEDRPVLVIYDGHTTQLSVDIIKTAIENQITILKLPPHTSHLLQPLNLSVFKSLKTRWDAKLVEWQRKKVGVKIPKSMFSKLIGELWTDTKPEIITNGFIKADICPINRNVIPVELFDPAALQRWKSFQAQKTADESLPSTSSVQDIDHQMMPLTSSAQDNDQMLTSTSRMHNEYQMPPDLSLHQNSVILNQDQVINSHKTETIISRALTKLHQTRSGSYKATKKASLLRSRGDNTERYYTFSTNNTRKESFQTEKNCSKKEKHCSTEENTASSDRISKFDDLSDAEMEETINNDENEILIIHHGNFVLSHFDGKKIIYKYVCFVTEVSDDEAEVTGLGKLKNSCRIKLIVQGVSSINWRMNDCYDELAEILQDMGDIDDSD
ncbi:hypothetical protein MML48_5g00012124 [Holotrichia oblita]|uniref:Uncharacterized protein n=1 Tax=Holotrichia oblita TaxID=644536 RepID=A0ACB9T1X6_HOLOL|nr:hypothetical protein MML48_5g00012124 [Holotrichia oblita]